MENVDNPFKIGDKVSLDDDTETGIVTKVLGDDVTVETDCNTWRLYHWTNFKHATRERL